MTTLTADQDVVAFAGAVRAALTDLAPEEVDDLTDGLEADLHDRVQESGAASLGDPAAYAEELREAAGLPHRATRQRRSPLGAIRRLRADARADRQRLADTHPLLAELGRIVVALRPAWWVLRAVGVYGIVASVMHWWDYAVTLPRVLLLLALVVGSVALGLRDLRARPVARWLVVALNLITAVAGTVTVLSALHTADQATLTQQMYDETVFATEGVYVEGEPVSNLFVYGPDGELVDGARIVDEQGRPVRLDTADMLAEGFYWSPDGELRLPSDEVPGDDGWNVYPLDASANPEFDPYEEGIANAIRVPGAAPFPRLQPLVGVDTPEDEPAAADDTDTQGDRDRDADRDTTREPTRDAPSR